MPNYKQKQGQAQFDCSEQSLQLLNQNIESALKIENLPPATSMYLISIQTQQWPWKSFAKGEAIDFVLNFQNDKITTPQITANNEAMKLLSKIPGINISIKNISGGLLTTISLSLSPDAKKYVQSKLTSPLAHPLDIITRMSFKKETPYNPIDNTYAKTNYPPPKTKKQKTQNNKKTAQVQNFSQINSKIIENYIFPKEFFSNLNPGKLKNYLLEQKKKSQKEIISLSAFMDRISNGTVPCTLNNNSFSFSPASSNEFANTNAQISQAKVGLTANGQVFMQIPQSEYNRIVKEQRTHQTEVSFPNYIVTKIPQDAQVFIDCKRKNGKWVKTNLLTQKNAPQKLSFFIADKQQFEYLARQNNDFKPPKKFTKRCGVFKDMQQVLDDKQILSPLIISALNLLHDNEGEMDKTWVETQAFFSFATYTTKQHQLVFGIKDGEYFVVDAQNKVRGKGDTKQDAITDMAKSGFCKTGVYYIYNKNFGQASSEKPTEILAVPEEDSWIYDALKTTSTVAQVGYFVPYGWTQAIAMAGTITQTIINAADRAERSFHLGHNHKWQPGEAEYLAADIAFIAGAAFGLGRFKFLSQFPRLVTGAQIAGFAGFGGFMLAGMSSTSKAQTQQMIDQYNAVGNPLTTKQEVPENWNEASEQLADLFYIFQDKYKGVSKDELQKAMKESFIPTLQKAYDEQMPLGLEGAEVAYAELMLLSKRIAWIKDNIETVKTISDMTNYHEEDIIFLFLITGGPQIEKSESYTKKLIEHTNKKFGILDPFTKAAEFLTVYSDQYNLPLNKQRTAEDLKMAWMKGDVKTSEIYNWAKAQTDFEIKYKSR